LSDVSCSCRYEALDFLFRIGNGHGQLDNLEHLPGVETVSEGGGTGEVQLAICCESGKRRTLVLS
jgi:hypothetical protein